MINMPQHGNHWSPPLQTLFFLLLDDLSPRGKAFHLFFNLDFSKRIGFKPHLLSHNGGRVKINLLIDIGDNPIAHQLLDDLNRTGLKQVG